MDLQVLLKQPEGKSLEFKRDLSSPDGVLKTIVAFANGSGGVLLIGVLDASRRVAGVKEPQATEERLASLISDHITPRLVPEIEVISWRRTHVLAIQVHPSQSRPHYLKREGLEGGAYVRVGSTNRRADRELVEDMRRYTRGESFDETLIPELNSEAIDFRVASELFAPVRKLRPSDLETLRLLGTHQGRKAPTIGGLLLFGRSPEREIRFPDAWIQAGRFAGRDKSRILDSVEIRSLPALAVEEAIAFVQKHSFRKAEIGPVRRTDRWSLPPIAVREAVINAVTHADYSQRGAPIRLAIFDDRLEMENPGLLPMGLVVEDLYRGVSKLRNRVIGRVFNALGFVEQWGSGVGRMTAACIAAGLPPPHFEEVGLRFRVTLGRKRIGRPSIDKIEHAILAAIGQGQGLSTSDIARVIKLTPRATRNRLARLVQHGLLREIGSGPQDPYRRYVRAE